MKNKSMFIFIIIFSILIILGSSFTSLINFITDYKWFSELGYQKTFMTKLLTQLKVGIPAFIIIFALLISYVMSIKKNYYKEANIITEKRSEKTLNTIFVIVSGVISLFITTTLASNLWFTILKFINGQKFNVADPIFNKDISFYVFKLPLIKEIVSIVLLLAFILIIATVITYAILLSIRRPAQDNISNVYEISSGRKMSSIFNKKIFNIALLQIGLIGFVIFIMIGINLMLNSYSLLYSARGVAYGASYTDVHVTLWIYRINAVIAVLSAIGFLIGVIKKKPKWAIAGPVLLIAITIVGNIGGGLVQRFIVEPDEISKEKEYLQYNIEFTQKAFGLDDVKQEDFKIEQNLTKQDLDENLETIKNIKINDYRPLGQVYNQLQGIRSYYQFNDIDIDRYNINGDYKQVFLSARELDQNKLNEQAKTWINKHLKYTHGYGVALSPVNSITPEGQPELLIKNIPPVTDTNLKIKRPEIYFGELTNDYVIVNSDEKEFDFPQGSDNKETVYEGTAGIKLGSFNKLLFSIREGSMKILISSNINSDSKIILNRDIHERVEKIAPFIGYDGDPYLVINEEDGKLYWIIDGYTTTNKYPYSQKYKNYNFNYIRNSVKVVIDAYNGTTKFYVFNEEDPIINTYKEIFSDLFESKDKMPSFIKVHTRYPQFLFDIQSDVYKVYHVDNPMVFYNGEDIWDKAEEIYMEGQQEIESNYLMFKIPGETKEEFLITVPYTPKGKPNLTGLFIARNDGDNYGKLLLYKFSKEKTVQGPNMIEAVIDQDSNISPQLTLWGQKGSKVLRGNLVIIPIENSLLYVEPIYIQADTNNSIPQVKKVIVSYKNKIVMENTLDAALAKVFNYKQVIPDDGQQIQPGELPDITDDFETLIKTANEYFEKSKEASQAGDWAKYGEYIKKLEEVLNKLNSISVNQ
ncbi:UPF0182 family protein [Abyssisolibacter fermentans]|uniref:UPF0182 family membrane protein n=1 Tax=Abyssisolibacter fermentans TaxID=1766203 RepID=UPI00082DC586|nr:UPF0182 family protein [Abyssisolibacter fermentans]